MQSWTSNSKVIQDVLSIYMLTVNVVDYFVWWGNFDYFFAGKIVKATVTSLYYGFWVGLVAFFGF